MKTTRGIVLALMLSCAVCRADYSDLLAARESSKRYSTAIVIAALVIAAGIFFGLRGRKK